MFSTTSGEALRSAPSRRSSTASSLPTTSPAESPPVCNGGESSARAARITKLRKQAPVLLQVTVAHVLCRRTFARVAAEPLGLRAVSQETFDGASERGQVGGVVDEQAMLPVDDLIGDASDGARDEGPRLPHRLRHRETESLGDALL